MTMPHSQSNTMPKPLQCLVFVGLGQVYNIKVFKKILTEAVCDDLFIHVFTGCDSTSRVFGIGNKSGFQRFIKNEQEMKDSSKVFC